MDGYGNGQNAFVNFAPEHEINSSRRDRHFLDVEHAFDVEPDAERYGNEGKSENFHHAPFVLSDARHTDLLRLPCDEEEQQQEEPAEVEQAQVAELAERVIFKCEL